jgi:hypothetical protein
MFSFFNFSLNTVQLRGNYILSSYSLPVTLYKLPLVHLKYVYLQAYLSIFLFIINLRIVTNEYLVRNGS